MAASERKANEVLGRVDLGMELHGTLTINGVETPITFTQDGATLRRNQKGQDYVVVPGFAYARVPAPNGTLLGFRMNGGFIVRPAVEEGAEPKDERPAAQFSMGDVFGGKAPAPKTTNGNGKAHKPTKEQIAAAQAILAAQA